jgi:tripartite-type tricarboxylate transporter receptor subunit TctC
MIRKATIALLIPVFATSWAPQAAPAQGFFAGKTITIATFTAPGGAYDAYIRLLARHMGRHIPGRPNFVANNQPGAGGLLNINYAGKIAPTRSFPACPCWSIW